MDKETKVGEYVRTKYGEIGVYIGQDLKYDMFDYDVNGNKSSCLYKDLVKHSPNIIDLIEEGDYVNGKKVIMNLKESKEWYMSKYDFVTCGNYTFENNEIKSIVTKEQFKSIEYIIEEK